MVAEVCDARLLQHHGPEQFMYSMSTAPQRITRTCACDAKVARELRALVTCAGVLVALTFAAADVSCPFSCG